MKKLSGVVITCNEEEKIERALRSLKAVADEIVVVDSFSRDRTPEICRALCDRFLQRDWEGFVDQKSFAMDAATHDWIFSLDADEELSPELQREILRWKEQGAEGRVAFTVPRLTRFMGRWIRHSTWYPDRQTRLFLRSKGTWAGGRVHESFRPEGRCGELKGHLYHYTYSTISEYLKQLDRFSTLASLDAYERGRRAGLTHLTLHPAGAFWKNYLIKRGFLDGIPGFVVSVLAAVSSFFKYLKLYELRRSKAD